MEQTVARPDPREIRSLLQAFLYLQLLDFLTTVLGLRLGLGEASPFVRLLTQMGPALGIALSKCVAVALFAICVWFNRIRVIRLINYWYAALAAWNLCLLVLTVAAV